MYRKDIVVIGGGGRMGISRLLTLVSLMPIQNGDFVVDHLGFVDYVEPKPFKKDNRLYYQRFDKPYGKTYRRSK